MSFFAQIGAWLEMAGGSRPLPESMTKSRGFAVARGLWWVLLFVLALVFAGRNTKFVYVDF